MKMAVVVFWIATPCSLVGGYQRFGGIYHLHLQSTSGSRSPSSEDGVIGSFETLLTTYKATRRHNPQDHNRKVYVRSWWYVALTKFCNGTLPGDTWIHTRLLHHIISIVIIIIIKFKAHCDPEEILPLSRTPRSLGLTDLCVKIQSLSHILIRFKY
jgi:hypothetical protein